MRMAARAFNLAKAISRLLAGLKDFRQRLQAAQPSMRQFREARRLYDIAIDELNKPTTALPDGQSALREAEAARARFEAELRRRERVLADRWSEYQSSIAFIGPYRTELELV